MNADAATDSEKTEEFDEDEIDWTVVDEDNGGTWGGAAPPDDEMSLEQLLKEIDEGISELEDIPYHREQQHVYSRAPQAPSTEAQDESTVDSCIAAVNEIVDDGTDADTVSIAEDDQSRSDRHKRKKLKKKERKKRLPEDSDSRRKHSSKIRKSRRDDEERDKKERRKKKKKKKSDRNLGDSPKLAKNEEGIGGLAYFTPEAVRRRKVERDETLTKRDKMDGASMEPSERAAPTDLPEILKNRKSTIGLSPLISRTAEIVAAEPDILLSQQAMGPDGPINKETYDRYAVTVRQDDDQFIQDRTWKFRKDLPPPPEYEDKEKVYKVSRKTWIDWDAPRISQWMLSDGTALDDMW